MREATKSTLRRYRDGAFHTRYFVGEGIDVGAGKDPVRRDIFRGITSLRAWDVNDGDAQHLGSIEDNVYDFLHSSHCLEDMIDPYEALENWIRVTKIGGFVILSVPDEDLYEQGVFPSTFNPDHKWTFTIYKLDSWSPKSINILDLTRYFSHAVKIERIQLISDFYLSGLGKRIDQTLHNVSECAIEIVLRKIAPVHPRPAVNEVSSKVMRGFVALNSNATKMAEVELLSAYSNNSNNPVALWGMAQYAKIKNEQEKAVEYLARAHRCNPNDSEILLDLLRYLTENDPNAAKTVLKFLDSRESQLKPEINQLLSQIEDEEEINIDQLVNKYPALGIIINSDSDMEESDS